MCSYKTRLMVDACLIGLFVDMAHAQEEGAAFAAAPIHFYDPPRLLAAPFVANIGGMGTLIGTPPNAVVANYRAALQGNGLALLIRSNR